MGRNIRFNTVAMFAILTVSAAVIVGQEQEPPRGDVMVSFFVLATDGSGQALVPASVSRIAKQISAAHPGTTLTLADAQTVRLANGANLETKSVFDLTYRDPNEVLPHVQELRFTSVRPLPNGVKPTYRINGFRYFVRVPFRRLTSQQEGQPKPATAFDTMFLNLSMINITAGEPTLIGSITVPEGGRRLYLIATFSKGSD